MGRGKYIHVLLYSFFFNGYPELSFNKTMPKMKKDSFAHQAIVKRTVVYLLTLKKKKSTIKANLEETSQSGKGRR